MLVNLIKELQNFLILQSELMTGLGESGFNALGEENVLKIRDESEIWEVIFHGSGALFTRKTDGLKINVENFSNFCSFDKYKLRSYFGSMKLKGVKLVSKNIGIFGLNLDESLDILIEMLEDKRIIKVKALEHTDHSYSKKVRYTLTKEAILLLS